MNISIKMIFALAVFPFAVSSVHAQTAGKWFGRVGATYLAPDSTSGNLTLAPTGSQIDLSSATQISGGITYMYTDNFSVDLPLALPFKHDVNGAGSFIGGAGKVATTKVVPLMVMGQYRFGSPSSQFRPYIGAGLIYASFSNERTTALLSAATGGTPTNPTTVSFDDKLSGAVQAGLRMNLTTKWFLDGNVIYSPLKTRGNLSTGQIIDVKLNPFALSLSVGMSFN